MNNIPSIYDRREKKSNRKSEAPFKGRVSYIYPRARRHDTNNESELRFLFEELKEKQAEGTGRRLDTI